MPSAGDKVRASDIPRRLVEATRNTNLGAAVSSDTALGIDAIFTLTRTRRVRVEFIAPMLCTTPGISNTGNVSLRRNATGAAIATSDTSVRQANYAGANFEAYIVWDELLTAGTYAYGPTLAGSGTTVNLNVGASLPAATIVWDMGDS